MKNLIATTDFEKDLMVMVSPVIINHGYELVRIKVANDENPLVQIMVEHPDRPIKIDECATLSKEISTILDIKNPIEANFNLEVSSPGIDRPLTRIKDFETWIGFKSTITTNKTISDRVRFSGVLSGLSGSEILLEIDEGIIGINIEWIKSAKLKYQ